MAAPTKNYKVGSVQMARWEKEFPKKDGEGTTLAVSFTMKKQKFDKDTKQYEDTDFLNVADLKDLVVMCQQALADHYFTEEAF